MKKSWLPAMISLAILLPLMASSCENARRAKVLEGCDDAIYFDGYTSGFNSGAKEGYSDALGGEAYSPSLKKIIYGGYRRSTGYWQGYTDGYDYGWSTPQDGAPKKGENWYEVAVTDASKRDEQDVAGYTADVADYNEGYSSGYRAGQNQALADSRQGEGRYSETAPESEIDNQCRDRPQDFRKGWIAGYKDGYRDNRNLTEVPEYQSGYEDGYKKGMQTGEMDKQAGYSYNDTINVYDLIGSQEYQRGFKDGYKKGYDKGYSGS
jgi:hypothetical protein